MNLLGIYYEKVLYKLKVVSFFVNSSIDYRNVQTMSKN